MATPTERQQKLLLSAASNVPHGPATEPVHAARDASVRGAVDVLVNGTRRSIIRHLAAFNVLAPEALAVLRASSVEGAREAHARALAACQRRHARLLVVSAHFDERRAAATADGQEDDLLAR
mmetsp:Transcript_31090/g.76129  ORF Transcript_31090/g.76129 Transcript_31090/m.76129 type:complete len:122 (-) Transcript_31090:2086-2451(-)